MRRWPAIASFVLFIALCVSVAYWAMQLFKPPTRPVAAPPPSVQPPPKLDAAAALFGGRSSVAVATNYQLMGVVVAGTPSESVAILSADGKPAQAIRAHMEVAPGVKVQEVHRSYVLLSEGGVSKRVELPENVKSQGSADVASRAPVATRPVPGQAPSAADARRSAVMTQAPRPTAPPPQPAPRPPEQATAPGIAAPQPGNPAPAGTTPGTVPGQPVAPQPVQPSMPPAPPQATGQQTPAPQLVPQQR